MPACGCSHPVRSGLIFGGREAAVSVRWMEETDPRDTVPSPSARRSDRRWDGLEIRKARLWFGQRRRLTSQPRARFDPDALVLVEKDGRETRLLWDDHDAGPRDATPRWDGVEEPPWYLDESD